MTTLCVFQEKCSGYWPTERSARYQYFVVDPLAEYNMPQYILREFKVKTGLRSEETKEKKSGGNIGATALHFCRRNEHSRDILGLFRKL